MAIYFILLGLVMGSFVNVIVCRAASGGSALKGRSRCPKCDKTLKWHELIPLVSFAVQGGKCRGCGEGISWQYPLAEILASGVFFILWQYYLKETWKPGFYPAVSAVLIFALSSVFIAALIYDFIYMEIPGSFLLWMLVLSFLFVFAKDLELIAASSGFAIFKHNIFASSIIRGAAGALAAGGFFFILVFASKEKWMGWGDVYLALALGFLLGWPLVLEALFLAFVSGSAIGIVLMVLKKKNLSSRIAFGPFLILSSFAALAWGKEILQWYLSLFIR